MGAKLVGRSRLGDTEFLIVDVTPEGVGVEFIYSYILVSGNDVLVVETGPQSSAKPLYEFLDKHGLLSGKHVHIAVTHIHLDHSGGAGSLAEMIPGSRIYVHPRGAKHLIDPSRLWPASRQALGWIAEVYGEPRPAPRDIVVETSDGQRIVIGDGVGVVFVHTPGHASHHQSIVVETSGKKILFTGDSAGMYSPEAGAVVPTTPPPFRYAAYMSSLDKQVKISPDMVAYTHKGLGSPSLLVEHRRQMELWRNVIYSQLVRGIRDEKRILEELKEVDDMTRKYIEETGMPALIETLIILSIRGFIEDMGG